MKRTLWAAVAVACTWLALPALADEYDFVGYDYSENYERDYDRGFFFGAEAWFVNPRNLHFEPALSTAGSPAPVGGVLLDVDYDHETTGRFFLGYQANRRVGRFTARYWDMHEDEVREEIGNGLYAATGTHPVRGDVVTDSFSAFTEVDVEYAEIEWRKDFGQGRRFTGFWTAAIHAWEVEYETEALFFNDLADHTGDVVRVNDFNNTQGLGGKVGLGGRFQFTDRFSMSAWGALGYSSTEQDYFYIDEDAVSGEVKGFIARDDTELSTLQYEGELRFNVRAAGGFEIDFGYRYLSFDDAIAEDRFVDNVGKFVAVEQAHELAFEGPFVGFRYITGLAKIDSDGDGVMDAYDDCPDTPAGAWANEKGCPRDFDEDGVYDGVDRCPGTAFGTRVDEWGCGVDSDGDGVADGLDLCPNTPDCAMVDGRGCPKDSDGDGVANGCDACPGSSRGMAVDPAGCETDMDSDGDTVPDSRDRCPGTARGAQVDADGCAQMVSMILHFGSDSATLDPQDKAQLDRIAQALLNDGGSFEVAGHADWQNTVEYNQRLSERRAASVRDYLVSQGVPSSRLTSVGYSELRPIADNSTPQGRAANRRVEIVRRSGGEMRTSSFR